MTTTKRAASPGAYYVIVPPIEKSKAAEIMGCDIPDEAWLKIRFAFRAFGSVLEQLSASKTSKSKGDPQGWHYRQNEAIRALEAALAKIDQARRHGNFLEEASENYSKQTFGESSPIERNARLKLDNAYQETLGALAIVERAIPLEIELPTEATARSELVRAIWQAFIETGIDAKASTGFSLEGIVGTIRLSDLTRFERLLIEFQIGDDRKPAAFSAFVRSAIGGEKQG